MNKLRITISMMVLTIAAIVLFQGYWLHKNYLEEKRLLDLRARLLFQETLFKLQNAKLHLDTSFSIRMPEMGVMKGAISLVREHVIADSPGAAGKTVFLTVRKSGNPGFAGSGDPKVGGIADSLIREISAVHTGVKIRKDTGRIDSVQFTMNGQTGIRVADILSGLDSLNEPVTAKEAEERFAQVLVKEGIPAAFTVSATPFNPDSVLAVDSANEPVILGFAKPMAYRLYLGNTFWVTARRMGPQALFSLVLVSVTVLSFLLLYRNWRQQQKLTVLKNDFISNITHELKTPIATVSVAVEALKNFNALRDPVRTQEYLDISAHELQRLSLLVDKVLKLSLFERQEIELKKEDFDLKMLVEDVMASMRLQFEKHQARVDMVTSGEERYWLRADKLHFTSVVYNLLDNALKYSGLGPVLRVDLHAETDRLVLAVADNGVGIPAGYQDRIFEKFFRVPTGDTHNVKGYGLGLSYVAYVIQRQGGEISVESKEGAGSRFTVKIPRGYA